MKNTLYTIITLVVIGTIAYVAMSKHATQPTPTPTPKISGEVIAQIASTTSMPIQQCSYDGQIVIKTDSRPVDGPLVLYSTDGTEIGHVTSGFGGQVETTINESKITDCTDLVTE